MPPATNDTKIASTVSGTWITRPMRNIQQKALQLRKEDLFPALESHLAKYHSLMPSIALIFSVEALSKGQPIASVRWQKPIY